MRRIIQRTVTTVKIVSLTLTFAEEAIDPSSDQAQLDQAQLSAPDGLIQPIEPEINEEAPPALT